MNFKSTFKSLRKEKGLSRRDLAIKFGIPYSTLLEYEYGETIPDEETLKKLADFFDVCVDYLLGKIGDRKVDYSLLNEDDKKEIANRLEEIRYELENSDTYFYGGGRLCQEDIDSIIEAMKIGLPLAKIKQKQSLIKKESQGVLSINHK